MSNQTCGECKYFDWVGQCDKVIEFNNVHAPDKACSFFEPLTNGDRIRQGGDDALIDFADGIRRKMCHYCAFFTDKSCVDKTGDCWEGVKAWLNAPADCVAENEKSATESKVYNGFAKCECCGKTYRKKKKTQRFCSIKCKDRWWNRERGVDREYLHPQCEDNFNGEW